MELRVWVDGTQRVVCGVKLTTTCQEIVFALAHATQQAGRFTMIERWRNNERLLSPNEQPLVTLQRWGDHMNEVEFILRKTSTDPQQPKQLRPIQQVPSTARPNHDIGLSQQPAHDNGHRESPIIPTTTTPIINDRQAIDPNTYPHHHHHYHTVRRPQTVLGQLTSSNSSLGQSPNYLQSQVLPMNRIPNSIRSSASVSTLPSANSNSMTALQSGSSSLMRSHYTDQMTTNSHNGYRINSESQQPQNFSHQPRADQTQIPRNYQLEDLYNTINKKRTNQPPAVPAKPRVIGSLPHINSFSTPHQQQIHPVNNAQMNYYHPNPSPLGMYANNPRPRQPPGYLDYLEAMANRNSLPQPIVQNSHYVYRNHPKLVEPGLIINRGSAVNVKLTPSSHHSDSIAINSSISDSDVSSSVSQIGHDMLKVIEEQKKKLMNQKNELDRLDNDQEYWEARQNSEQVEMTNRVANEIHQLEKLWKENQAQIKKFENQGLEREVQNLKDEYARMESEVKRQKERLSSIDKEIAMCKTKIEHLEATLSDQESDTDDSVSSIEEEAEDEEEDKRGEDVEDEDDKEGSDKNDSKFMDAYMMDLSLIRDSKSNGTRSIPLVVSDTSTM